MSYYYRYEYSVDSLKLRRYRIIKRTKKGVWISSGLSRHFILLKAENKFAYSSKEQALNKFVEREFKNIVSISKKHFIAEMIYKLHYSVR